MRRPTRLVAFLLLLALFAAACTDGDDNAAEDPEATPAEEGDADGGEETTGDDDGGDEGAVTSGGAGGDTVDVPVAEGAVIGAVDPAILQAAQTWIADESGLTEMLQEEIFLSAVSTTIDVTHLTYVQQHDGVSVRGAQFIVHVRDTGEVIGASQSLTETLPGEVLENELTLQEAIDIAEKAVPGSPERSEGTAIWLETGETLSLGYEVFVSTVDPPGSFSVVVDGVSGDVLATDVLGAEEQVRRDRHSGPATLRTAQVAQAGAACQAPAPPSACIFVVDPFFSSGATTISADEANSQLVGVALNNLLDPNDGNLVGRFAQIYQPLAPVYADPDNVFGEAGRGGVDVTFEAAMTYYWIDYTQGVIQSIGFDFHGDDPVDFVPIEPEFPDNAFYTFNEDRIHMGAAADGVNEAEDAQGIIHEYGHALVQAAIPNITSPEGGAFHEGFADLVSVFTTLEFRNGDLGCLFHWAERGRCIRRIDTDKTYPADLTFEVHLDGEIYTGAVWDIFEQVLLRDTGLTPDQCQQSGNPCDAVRDQVYGTALGSMPFLTPQLTLNDAAQAFAASDQTFYGGANADIIAATFAARGMPVDGMMSDGGTVMIGGLDDGVRSSSQVTMKIVHDFRGDLDVRLDVVTPAGEILCTSQLLSPDPNDGGDNVTGRFDLVGSQCEPFLPPGPEQIWVLRVADTLAQDEGSLFQFVVIHQGVRYVAPGLPVPIPDADPQGVLGIIGLGTQTDTMVDPAQPAADDATAAGTVTAEIQLTHTYIGDLQVQIGVLDLTNDLVACRIDVREPDPQDDSDDLDVQVDASACSAFFPPTAEQPWALRVVDNAGLDEGTIDAFTVSGGGAVFAEQGPVPIPDNDPGGAVLLVGG